MLLTDSRLVAALGRRINDPHDLFRNSQNGAWWNLSSSSLLYTTSSVGGSAPTDGQTIALAIGSRAANPLGAGAGSNLIVDGSWTMSVNGGTGTATNSPSGTLNLTGDGTNSATGSQSLTTVVGRVYKISFTVGVNFSPFITVGATDGGQENITAASISLTANTSFNLFFTATVATTWVRFARTAATGPAVVSGITVRSVPAILARQSSTPLKPTWRSASGGYADFDLSDDVLPSTFPAAFTGDVFYLLPDGSIVELIGQSVTTTYNLPAVDMKHVVVRATMTASERNALRSWMRRQPLS